MAVAAVLAHVVSPYLQDSTFALFFVAVVTVGWLGGVGPAILAQVLSVAIAVLVMPRDPERPPDPPLGVLAGMAAFVFVGIAAGLLSHSMRRAQRNARTEAEEAIRQREQLRATLAGIADGVIVTDIQAQITLMNSVATRLTGWEEAEAAGQPLRAVFQVNREGSPDPADSAVRNVLAARPHRPSDQPVLLTSRDGSVRPIDFSAAPIDNAALGMTGLVVVFRDETERRRTEQALLDADRRKDEFLALVAHELRNPLAPIGNALQLLKLPGVDAELQDETRVIIERQFEHLVRLVDDLLDVSRIARGKITLKPEHTTLDAVLQRAVEAARPAIDDRRHALDIHLPPDLPPLRVDVVRIAQVFTNLLNNAAKYTDPGGRIGVAAVREDNHIVVRVQDTGIGISAGLLPKVFDMFMQVEQGRSRSNAGLGIGLTLVRTLTEMHGGRVAVHSDGPGKGCEFTVRLPSAAHAVNGQAPAEDDATPFRARKVLIVDDNVDSAVSLARLLEARGHTARAVHTGTEALSEEGEFRPDVVFLDLGMPEMDGFSVARELRSRRGRGGPLLVALTGWGGAEDRMRTSEAGFDFHFVKPIRAEDAARVLSLER
ncbi:MAG: response regulator [Planctomyces sp.]|nr:response regulator [Planctomyces sp.]